MLAHLWRWRICGAGAQRTPASRGSRFRSEALAHLFRWRVTGAGFEREAGLTLGRWRIYWQAFTPKSVRLFNPNCDSTFRNKDSLSREEHQDYYQNMKAKFDVWTAKSGVVGVAILGIIGYLYSNLP